MQTHGIKPIDLVVVNLYAFEATVSAGNDFSTCVENIDIGGPSMLRSASKNHASVVICTAPSQYGELMSAMSENNNAGSTPYALRRRFAAAAFAHSAAYDSAIAQWFSEQLEDEPSSASTSTTLVTTRAYKKEFSLKYGCNPHQNPAGIYSIVGHAPPFTVINGSPGYINLLDAVNAYQLVAELRQALNMPAATSFKHVSPAGAAIATPLTPELELAYEVAKGPDAAPLTPLAVAYIRARNADPLCSFGDFVAVSDVVDEATARVLQKEVSDGIIAPGYEPAALAILTKKKAGKFVVLQATPGFVPPEHEWREVGGATFMQKRNNRVFDISCLEKVATDINRPIPAAAAADLVLASITLKYTQSNSIAYAIGGQVVGVGAGQQSRVDCVKLAARKVGVWYLRQHPKVQGLPFKPGVKRQARVNARVAYIDGDLTPLERAKWEEQFTTVPPPLTAEEKAAFLGQLDGVALSSDAFFPFRDSIDYASKVGVKYIVQPGGSVGDTETVQACNEYGMAMAFSNFRLFHH
jgi:phosphoribosylaminoimidazolecarboxamide formyltransferase/IMP cyclohydrolase